MGDVEESAFFLALFVNSVASGASQLKKVI